MAPSCALSEDGLRQQLGRYRQIGARARILDRTRRHVVIDLGEDVDTELVEQAIEIERECCPFFSIDWQRARRELTISVALAENEPALDAIAFALGLEQADKANEPE